MNDNDKHGKKIKGSNKSKEAADLPKDMDPTVLFLIQNGNPREP